VRSAEGAVVAAAQVRSINASSLAILKNEALIACARAAAAARP
jgi:hypothetical protein